ncbi:MAG TPA: methyltransferase [Lentisphaeria bacterium]|nr:MAG: hypothetical protein A2X47_00460 [Lentisphaerae bacterium GWF2_38_69]HBM16883.1 methyltransferase [Lentisphaeria bacterium]
MPQTSREIVRRSLDFDTPERMPRDLWVLPEMERKHPGILKKIREAYPSDFAWLPGTSNFNWISSVYNVSPRLKGNPYKAGEYIDEWGCVFDNVYDGIIGEIKKPLIEDISDINRVIPPYEILPSDYAKARDFVNSFCGNSDKFVFGSCCPRLWERIQFILGTENAMMDIMLYENEFRDLLRIIHDFNLKELEFWASTDVDVLMFMDDWGCQNQLLLRPEIWRNIFKPLYKEYCDLAHSNGKYIFMHSDGYIIDIYKDLIEIGVNAVNSQLFCMDMRQIAKEVKNKITFWGEIDRQHVLVSNDLEKGRAAVRKVAESLYNPKGGIIAQFELGTGANPDMAMVIYDEWEKIQKR